ncbi:MAG TPA: hypothetical protein VG944_08550 [Fimbriimonas sp.]|nr:hypothetical protein [Fimbriimonas sp.]
MIRCTNHLLPLGKGKALAALSEFDRLNPRPMPLEDNVFWLTRLLFVPKDPPGFFALPMIGAIEPPPPKNLRKWPVYPVVVQDDVPFLIFGGVTLFGHPESFSGYVKRDSKNWRIREAPLRPSDDPFEAMLRAQKTWAWRYLKSSCSNMGDRVILLRVLKDLLSSSPLGRDPDLKDLDSNPGAFRRLHRKFLASHCHWDVARQLYVAGR